MFGAWPDFVNNAIASASLLPSNSFHLIIVFCDVIRNPNRFISFNISIIGIASLEAYESAVYSRSVALRKTSPCG